MLLNKLPPGVCGRGEGATGLLKKEGGASKQQAVEFPQVLTSIILLKLPIDCYCIIAIMYYPLNIIGVRYRSPFPDNSGTRPGVWASLVARLSKRG